MAPGVSISIIWFDEDILELRVAASNGRFTGTTELYDSLDSLQNFAQTLHRFPTRASDERTVSLGAFDPMYAGGGANLRFHCIDAAAHAAVEVSIRSDRRMHPPDFETASFSIGLEAAAIDLFVQQLREMKLEDGRSAQLSQRCP